MFSAVGKAIRFMTPWEKIRFFVFLAMRALVAIFDLIGILAIGYLATSMALFLTEGSDPGRVLSVGALTFPAVSAQTLPYLALAILALFIAKALASVFLTYRLAFLLAGIEARSARTIAENAFGRGLQGSRQNSREDILFAVQSGSPSAFNGLLNSTGTLVAEAFLFILVISAFAVVNPFIAIGAIVYFGVIGFLIQFFIGRLMEKSGRKITSATVEANSGLSDIGDVMREVATTGRLGYFYERVYRSRLNAAGNYATQFVLSGMPRYIVETSLIVAIAVFILIQSLSGDISSSAATVGIFLSGGLRLTASLLPLQAALLSIKQSLPPAEKAFDLLDLSRAKAESTNPPLVSSPFNEPVSVKIQDLNFSYSGSEVSTLININMRIPAGDQAAFIGLSGAGKSTLADLILGLMDPTSGKIYVNDFSPRDLSRSHPGVLGYVPQKPGMISGTILQNIALGVEEAEIDEGRLHRAISDAHLSEFVENLPDGLRTDIGKRKDELSGGQLQRIGLARALYAQPKLLILDEATSALDAESENEINKALDDMRGKVTVILIAHRLNTIQRSDVVFLLESGTVAASGSFAELLKDNLKVKNLAKLMSIETETP